MGTVTTALLLLADISGYTSFMRQNPIATTHANDMIARLLRTLVQTSRPPLKTAEIEGDAVFFFAQSKGGDIREVATSVAGQIPLFFAAFLREITVLKNTNTCGCEACGNVDQLKLKQVLHVGDVAVEKIGSFEKLIGYDVIVAHRMLKSTAPTTEYVLMSKPALEAFGSFFGLEPERRIENFEGVGKVETFLFNASQLKTVLPLTDAAGIEDVSD